MENKIECILVDYMINYFEKGGIECPCCKSNISAEDISNIPLWGTHIGIIKEEYYKTPYICKNCGVRIEKMVC